MARLIVGLCFAFAILYWAVNNPNSASSVVDNIVSAYNYSYEFVTENFFDNN